MLALAARLVGARFAPFLVSGGAVLLVVGALWWWGHSKYQAGVSDANARWEHEIQKANTRYLEQKARADELAANQRITDTIAVNRQEEELRDAIASTPDSAPDAVRIRLGCERLRRRSDSASAADLPAVCRASG